MLQPSKHRDQKEPKEEAVSKIMLKGMNDGAKLPIVIIGALF